MNSFLEIVLKSILDGTSEIKLSDNVKQILAEDETVKKNLRALIENPNINLNDLLPSVKTPTEKEFQTDLEAIILTVGRPVFLIKNDSFGKIVDLQWTEHLEKARTHIESAIKAVGRVDLSYHPEFSSVGTAWLVTPDIVITNRHVVEKFAEKNNDKFVFGINDNEEIITARINFKAEHNSIQQSVFKVEEILHIENRPGPDIAFLRISKTNKTGSPLSQPILLPEELIQPNRNVAVIGYPMLDSREADYELQIRLFNNVFNVKRLQPGLITGVADVIEHDCSTLGGNSGSVVLDLDTGKALGIHFGARKSRKSNVAVPASIIKKRLEDLKLS
ncbi:MAG TPA: hypothetical protein DCL61_13260 [Cyanobacteria bacterium UBA12227]|nr:hypothetical protein [Cyanobacteria bacterium UBA12227]HAX88479.1 hypothetical protein [Cyanobacteria bacterium UBA11370]HBY81446.1 hypothetical protein [Cyanobacteria bacterium UBA11148]